MNKLSERQYEELDDLQTRFEQERLTWDDKDPTWIKRELKRQNELLDELEEAHDAQWLDSSEKRRDEHPTPLAFPGENSDAYYK